MSTLWSNDDIEELKRLVHDGKSVKYLAEYFGRTETAIELKVNRLGLQILRCNRNWLKEDLDSFCTDWLDGSISLNSLIKKYNRTYFSMRKKALELGLGARPHNEEYLSIREICEEMNVSHDRVSNWLRLGLKYKINRSGKTRYLISQNSLLKFLESHQDMFDASKISEYLFIDEPQWLLDKRKKDTSFYTSKLRSEYTNNDDIMISNMFKLGKSNKEIATALKRTESAIEGRLRILGYSRHKYNDFELDILRDNSDYMTLSELTKLLPLRSERGIAYMCKKLGLSYHMSKERCKKRD